MLSEASDFYNSIGRPRLVLAPMVEQSELAFRMLSREFGAQLTYSPMWHAAIFSKNEKYRKDALQTCSKDHPFIIQFCANDAETFAQACELAEPHCDAVDLNLGCPQIIAKRGHYGAYLMEEVDRIEKIISTASARISKPVTCKIRVFSEIEKTVYYAQRMEKAGAKLITVHGRRRDQRGPLTGVADWEHIRAVKRSVTIPVFANGNIQFGTDVQRCIDFTGVDGVMVAEGALSNPAIFTCRQPPAWEMSEKYLAYAEQYPTTLGTVRGHLFRIWFHALRKHDHLRTTMGKGKSVQELSEVAKELSKLCQKDAEVDIANGVDCESPGKLPYWRCQPYIRPAQNHGQKKRPCDDSQDAETENSTEKSDVERGHTIRKKKRIKKATEGKGVFPKVSKKEWPICKNCQKNPWGLKCPHNWCKKCCKQRCAEEKLNCRGHKCRFADNTDEENSKKVTDGSDEPPVNLLVENVSTDCNAASELLQPVILNG